MEANRFKCTYREHYYDKKDKLKITEPKLPSKDSNSDVEPLKEWEGHSIERVCFLKFNDYEYLLKRAEKH